MSPKHKARLESDLLKSMVGEFHAEVPSNLGIAIASLLQTYTEGILARYGELVYEPRDLDELEHGLAAAFERFEQVEIVDYIAHRDLLSFLIGYFDEKSRAEEVLIDEDLLH